MNAVANKWIITVPREIHLGYIKDTFRRGAVIELKPELGILVIDGRKFNETRDLEILRRASLKHPNNPWVIPYTDEAYAQVVGGESIAEDDVAVSVPEPVAGMEIVKDDSDDHPIIDIRHTQVSKQTEVAKQASRSAAHNREVGGKMDVIRGDETAEERLSRLKGKGDAKSISERVSIKRQRTKMPVIHDDSLGMGVNRSEIPMNAGQHLPTREEADSKAIEKQIEAGYRKREIEMARKRAGIESLDNPEFQDILPELAESIEVVGVTTLSEIAEDIDILSRDTMTKKVSGRECELQTENETLKAQNVALKDTQDAIMARLAALESRPKAKTPKKASKAKKATKKTSKKAPKKATKVKRTPVAAKE